MGHFFRERPPGQSPHQTHQSVIMTNLYEIGRRIPDHLYKHDLRRILNETSLSLAVDSTGQHVLLGGSYRGSNCFVHSIHINNSSNKYDQMIWGMSNNDLCRLQFIPQGNNLHAVTSNRGLKIIDTNEQRILSELNSSDHTSTHWSDWHPKDPNLLASCNEVALELVDRRDRWMSSTLTLANYRKSGCTNSYMEDGFASSCFWSPKNDNQLIVGNLDGSLVTYDRRNLARIANAKVEGYYLSDLQMTPNRKYLFGWCRSNNTLYQWKYKDKSFKQHLDEYGVRIWNMAKYPEFMSRNFQYYLTNKHLCWPDVYRVSAVVGLKIGRGNHKIYTLGSNMGLQIWSIPGKSQGETAETRLEIGKRQKFSM